MVFYVLYFYPLFLVTAWTSPNKDKDKWRWSWGKRERKREIIPTALRNQLSILYSCKVSHNSSVLVLPYAFFKSTNVLQSSHSYISQWYSEQQKSGMHAPCPAEPECTSLIVLISVSCALSIGMLHISTSLSGVYLVNYFPIVLESLLQFFRFFKGTIWPFFQSLHKDVVFPQMLNKSHINCINKQYLYFKIYPYTSAALVFNSLTFMITIFKNTFLN